MFPVWELTITSHPLGVAHSIFPLTLLNTCQSVHQLGTHVGTLPPSLISFHVAQSNNAKCQSVAEAGHTTSHVLVVYQSGLVELYGVYHKAVVTSKLVIHVINHESLFKSEISSHG